MWTAPGKATTSVVKTRSRSWAGGIRQLVVKRIGAGMGVELLLLVLPGGAEVALEVGIALLELG
jgi:hypothetical protein